MRSIRKDQQNLWFTKITESIPEGSIDTKRTYEKPVCRRFTISNEGGIPLETGMGIVPHYERYITTYTHEYVPEEGMLVYVDKEPELDAEGELVLDENNEPTVKPDFYVRRIMTNKKASVVRAALVKVDGVKDIHT